MASAGARRQDDRSIPNSEDLYRRVRGVGDERAKYIVRRHDSGRPELTSQAFSDPTGEVSVDRSSLITPEGCLALGDVRHLGVVAVTAGQARSLDQVVVSDPIDGDPEHGVLPNPAHALICGKAEQAPKSRKRIARALARMARWVYPPDQNPLA